MIKSMTGYGRAEGIRNGKKLSVEIKSLNHRYLEVSLRIPGIISAFEMAIKKKIGERFSRGRVDVTIRLNVDGVPDSQERIQLNMPLLQNYYSLLKQMKQELGLSENISLAVMSGFRDAFIPVEVTDDPDDMLLWVEEVLGEAMSSLALMREKEGEALCLDLKARLALIQARLEGIAQRTPQVVLNYQRRLSDRVKELTGGLEIDEARLCQEIAIMAEKSDITEEVIRFKSHIEQVMDLMESNDSVGRKVDFLIQEMNREVNTIGSKSGDSEISRDVVEIKSELSRLREQVQNLE